MPTNDQTTNIKLNKPDFDQALWHDLVNDNWEIIDATITTYLAISGIVGVWENNTAYSTGDKVIDTDTSTVYECAVAHTSASSPTTFSQDRANNPTFWRAPSIAARGLGNWTAATQYQPNDFVIGNGNIFAVCIAAHTSGASFTGDAAYWDYLLDLSGIPTLPVMTGHALEMLRVNAAASAIEYRTPANVRADLSLGTMALQDASAVNITGGSISTSAIPGLGALAFLSTVGAAQISADAVNNTHVATTLITAQTEDTTPDVLADYVLVYDASAGSFKKVLLSNAGGSDSLFRFLLLGG